jgi:hypothetical protein
MIVDAYTNAAESVAVILPWDEWAESESAMHLDAIEGELRTLLADIKLRTTLERAGRIGSLLDSARPQVPHGRWATWLKRLGLNRKTASDYILACRGLAVKNVRPVGQIGLRAFLEALRAGKRAEIEARRAEAREAAAGVVGELPDSIRLVHADCREFRWPRPIDLITSDPPWDDLDAVEWLAGFAAGHLREGGLLLLQCSTHNLPAAIVALQRKLRYAWTLAIVYHHANQKNSGGVRFRSIWKPVLVFSKGQPHVPNSLSDTYTVHRGDKRFHPWQQPYEPWHYWLGRLATANALVAETHVGCGTIPLVCHALGLRFVGTEIDERTYQIARGRLAGIVGR